MRSWSSLISPWVLGGLLLWIVLMLVATWWAIPIFANISFPGLNCTPTPCPTPVTTEWTPSLAFGVVVATIVVGTLAGVAVLLRRRH
jgi:hypothetical protein